MTTQNDPFREPFKSINPQPESEVKTCAPTSPLQTTDAIAADPQQRWKDAVKSAGASNPAAGSPIPPADGNPSYEQRLWDEYAGRAMESLILALKPQIDDMGYVFPSSWRPIVSGSQKFATEMMAERAKRLKGETK